MKFGDQAKELAHIRPTILAIQKDLTGRRSKKLSGIAAVWNDALGDDLANLAFPYELQSDILKVSVSSPSVRFTIEQLLKQAIIEQLNELSGSKIRDIKCIFDRGRDK
jgi:hypothetical protein